MRYTWPQTISDHELRQAIVEWSELLAKKRFADALRMFDLSDDKYAEHWTPELLETRIANYGCPNPDPEGRVFAVTSLYELPGVDVEEFIARHIQVDRENLYGLDPTRYLGMIHYDWVPLNGEPSDLTAQFHIKQMAGRQLTLEFVDIHVM